MKTLRIFVALLFTVSLALPTAVKAELEPILFLDGIPGDTSDADYPGWIDILDWSWSSSNPDRRTAIVRPIEMSGDTSSHSPQLQLALIEGTVFPTAILVVKRVTSSTKSEYLRLTMTNAYVTSMQNGGIPVGQFVPIDRFSLMFDSICYRFNPLNDDGANPQPIERCFAVSP